jgi:hypothetical protein
MLDRETESLPDFIIERKENPNLDLGQENINFYGTRIIQKKTADIGWSIFNSSFEALKALGSFPGDAPKKWLRRNPGLLVVGARCIVLLRPCEGFCPLTNMHA